ncbi:MAG: ABC transporter permease [Actinobacteria bacterium]|nr:ABC transporter permease [Actinomycetota bacterium]
MLNRRGKALWSRIIQLLILLWSVSTVLFLLLRLSGDPALILAGEGATPEIIEAIRIANGFDKPLITQYFVFIRDVINLDFGNSLVNSQPALSFVLQYLPSTLKLTFLAIVFNTIVAIPAGIWLGAKPNQRKRRVLSTIVSVAQGTPSYVIGLILIQIFAVWLGWLPSIANTGPGAWILPTATLAFALAPNLIRVLAANVEDTTRQDYYRTAKANGANPTELLIKHSLPNALLSATSLLGAQFAFLLSGALITEFIFAWPGLGLILVQSITNLDFPTVQATVFVVACLVFFVNLVMDQVFRLADPRLRKSQL